MKEEINRSRRKSMILAIVISVAFASAMLYAVSLPLSYWKEEKMQLDSIRRELQDEQDSLLILINKKNKPK